MDGVLVFVSLDLIRPSPSQACLNLARTMLNLSYVSECVCVCSFVCVQC